MKTIDHAWINSMKMILAVSHNCMTSDGSYILYGWMYEVSDRPNDLG